MTRLHAHIRRTCALLAGVLGASLLPATVVLAQSVSPSVTVEQWSRDAATPSALSYSVRVDIPSADPCQSSPYNGYCLWRIEAWYRDGNTDQRQFTIGSGAVAVATSAGVGRGTQQGVLVPPVTYLRTTITPYSGATPIVIDTPLADSYAYPVPDPSVVVRQWRRSADKTQVDYDIEVRLTGMGSPGAPCWRTPYNMCHVELIYEWFTGSTVLTQGNVHLDLQTVDTADGHSPSTRVIRSAVTLAPVNQIQVKITPYGASTPAYAWFISVVDAAAYPTPNPYLHGVRWAYNPNDGNKVSYEFRLDFAGMGSPHAPCWRAPYNACQYELRYVWEDAAGTTVRGGDSGFVTTTDSASGHSPSITIKRDAVTMEAANYALGTIRPYGSQSPAFSFRVPLSRRLNSTEASQWEAALLIAPFFTGASAEAVCLAVAELPGTHFLNSTASDQTMECNAAQAAGARAAAVAAVRSCLGNAVCVQAVVDAVVLAGSTVALQRSLGADGRWRVPWPPPIEDPDFEPEPEPQPSADGAMHPPNDPNCLTAAQRAALLEVVQEHHIATTYDGTSLWATQFTAVLGQHGLAHMSLQGDWNRINIPHKGPHPVGYHSWVMDNLTSAAEYASSRVEAEAPNATEAFKAQLREQYFRQQWQFVRWTIWNDPAIVRSAWWNC